MRVRSCAIIDYSRTDPAEGKWKTSEISSVKAKRVFPVRQSFSHRGEAESHRSYWQPLFTPGNAFLVGGSNPGTAEQRIKVSSTGTPNGRRL
jgi:endo-alpha-1,4-polygalactosaminidase (GH114 family)